METLRRTGSQEAGVRPRRMSPKPRSYERFVKPTFDTMASGLLLLATAPIMVGIAVATRIAGRGPIFFIQTRIGQHGRRIRVIRFRAVDVRSQLWQLTLAHAPVEVDLDSPGLTPIGRLLLRTRLDRLPELVNVLRGEMSLVGPRPPLPYEVERYLPVDWIRLRARPGLTCLWQLDREAGSREAAMSSDYRYVAEMSLRLDLLILLRTATALVAGRIPS
jgi:lipopolysaccharide/colanic/teichoic acid biosynthesis glycosyltransferase